MENHTAQLGCLLTFLWLIVHFEAPVHAETVTNWALGRPTSQSSTRNIGYPSKAVDGITGGYYINDGCTETKYEVNPWWVVDLGQPINVTSVTVFNRVDCCAERLHDYFIGLTDVAPSAQAPSPGGYSICHHAVGIAPDNASITCDSFTRGRYLFIQILGENELLTLCEVQVYECQASDQASLGITNIVPFHWKVDGQPYSEIKVVAGGNMACGGVGGLKVYVDVAECGGPMLQECSLLDNQESVSPAGGTICRFRCPCTMPGSCKFLYMKNLV